LDDWSLPEKNFSAFLAVSRNVVVAGVSAFAWSPLRFAVALPPYPSAPLASAVKVSVLVFAVHKITSTADQSSSASSLSVLPVIPGNSEMSFHSNA